jgi:Leucine-rich repeat (LRR) protein
MLNLKYLNVSFIKININKINIFLNLNFNKYFFNKIGYLSYINNYANIDYVKYTHIINNILLTNNKLSTLFIYFIIYNHLINNLYILKEKTYLNKYY